MKLLILGATISNAGFVSLLLSMVALFTKTAPELLPWYLGSTLALLAGNALAKNAGAKNDV